MLCGFDLSHCIFFKLWIYFRTFTSKTFNYITLRFTMNTYVSLHNNHNNIEFNSQLQNINHSTYVSEFTIRTCTCVCTVSAIQQVSFLTMIWLNGPIFMMFWNCSYISRSVNWPLKINNPKIMYYNSITIKYLYYMYF